MYGRFYVKRTAMLAILIAAVGLSSCGSYSLRTITLASFQPGTTNGSTELKGMGATLQFQATGNYSNFTSKDLTQRVTYNVTVTACPMCVDANGIGLPIPPNTVTVDATGLMTSVTPAVCTFVETQTNPATFALTGSYTVTATFGNITSNPVFIGVASAAGPGGICGP